MTRKNLLIAAGITTALLISISAYAGGGMGGGIREEQGMMGSQGHGMMGRGGNGMMDAGPNYSTPWNSEQSERSPGYYDKPLERPQLREEILKKRQELSELYRSDKPDKALIDQKITELHALEKDYDQNFSGAE